MNEMIFTGRIFQESWLFGNLQFSRKTKEDPTCKLPEEKITGSSMFTPLKQQIIEDTARTSCLKTKPRMAATSTTRKMRVKNMAYCGQKKKE